MQLIRLNAQILVDSSQCILGPKLLFQGIQFPQGQAPRHSGIIEAHKKLSTFLSP
jgi:hypothetical protein